MFPLENEDTDLIKPLYQSFLAFLVDAVVKYKP